MRDDYLSPEWARSHRAFSDWLSAVARTISVSLKRLHTEQFDAPWKAKRAPRGRTLSPR